MKSKIRLLIVDDHRMFREGIRKRLEEEPDFTVVGETATAEEALVLVEKKSPTIVLLDIRLPSMSGIEAARVMHTRWPDLKVLILTGYDFDQYVRAAARAGIKGYLLKDAPQDSLVSGIREIAKGGTVLAPNIASKVIQNLASSGGISRRRPTFELTVRELEVVEMLYRGLRNTEIGRHLSISPRTVEAHVGNIILKLGAQSRTEAVRIASEKKLVG